MSDIKDVIINGVTYPIKDQSSRDMLDVLESRLADVEMWKSELFATLYPVGSTYITTDAGFNPGNVFGGTWSRIAKGKALVGVDENSSITNMKSYVAAGFGQANAIIPYHNHSTTNTSSATITGGSHAHQYGHIEVNRGTGSTKTRQGPFGWNTANVTKIGSSTETHTHSLPAHTHAINYNGESVTDKNYQPSVAVYIWRCDSR